jgi:hypothetical protein
MFDVIVADNTCELGGCWDDDAEVIIDILYKK